MPIKMPDFDKFQQVVRKFQPDSKLLRAWSLTGGVSAETTALEVQTPEGQIRRMVVRRHGDTDLQQSPNVAATEFKVLHIASSLGLATPKPCYVDGSCEIFRTPYIIIEYIDGETNFAPPNVTACVRQLAVQLSKIHEIDNDSADLSFLPMQSDIIERALSRQPSRLDDSIEEGRIREVLRSSWPLPQRNRPTLLHGDFWPGNVLWKDVKLAAVIDWEDTQYGDPLADLANARLEILWAFGVEAMREFTHKYQSLSALDYADLPYWDLFAALRPAFKIADFAEDDAKEKVMRERHEWFRNQAFAAL